MGILYSYYKYKLLSLSPPLFPSFPTLYFCWYHPYSRQIGFHFRSQWPFSEIHPFLTTQLSISMVFCGPCIPLAVQFACGPGRGGPQTNWKANRWFPFIWLRRRGRPRFTIHFVGGLFVETIVPLGIQPNSLST